MARAWSSWASSQSWHQDDKGWSKQASSQEEQSSDGWSKQAGESWGKQPEPTEPPAEDPPVSHNINILALSQGEVIWQWQANDSSWKDMSSDWFDTLNQKAWDVLQDPSVEAVCSLTHTWKQGKKHTIYDVDVWHMQQTSQDNGKVRKIRAVCVLPFSASKASRQDAEPHAAAPQPAPAANDERAKPTCQ